jgi:hypothetical protein
MNMANSSGVEIKDGKLGIPMEMLQDQVEKTWDLRQLGRRVLVQPSSFAEQVRGKAIDQGYCSIWTFMNLVSALNQASFRGAVYVDIGIAVKTLYFNKGELVFASSNIIDDRLGEVCYRESLIGLEALLNSTVQVDKNVKFGQVLLRDQVFTNVELHGALCAQVVHIVQSVFMAEEVYFEVVPQVQAPLQVVQEESFANFLEKSLAFGAMYRDFKARIELDSSVELKENFPDIERRFSPGTFYGDLLVLVRENTYLSNILQFSKLHEFNTLAALMHLYNRGIVNIQPMFPIDPEKYGTSCSRISSALDVYVFVTQKARELFAAGGVPFPVSDLINMLAKIEDGTSYFALDQDLRFEADCVHRMMVQGTAAKGRISFFERQIDRLAQFIIQVTMDTLSFKAAKELKGLYDQLSSS